MWRDVACFLAFRPVTVPCTRSFAGFGFRAFGHLLGTAELIPEAPPHRHSAAARPQVLNLGRHAEGRRAEGRFRPWRQEIAGLL